MGTSGTSVLTVHGTWRGFGDLFPVALFFSAPFGIAFGTAATDAGLLPWQAIAMSAVVFSGVAQFAALDFLNAQIAWGSFVLVIFAISARHVVMGAALAPWVVSVPAAPRFALLAWLSDANFAHSQAAHHEGERDVGFLLGGGLALWVTWVLGTGLGALSGNVLGDLSQWGLDVVMITFFAAMVSGGVKHLSGVPPLAVAAITAMLLGDLLPNGWNIIIAGLTGGLTSFLQEV